MVKAWRPGEVARVGVDGRAIRGVNQPEGEQIIVQISGNDRKAQRIGFADRIAGQRCQGRRDIAPAIAQRKVSFGKPTRHSCGHAIGPGDRIGCDHHG